MCEFARECPNRDGKKRAKLLMTNSGLKKSQPEEWKACLTFLPNNWRDLNRKHLLLAKLDEDVRNYLDKIIDGEERIEEIHNQINEQLTQTTFDGVYNNFIDTLMDMKASSKDAAEDISEYFMRAMLSEQVGALYQDKLKKWYEKFAKGMRMAL